MSPTVIPNTTREHQKIIERHLSIADITRKYRRLVYRETVAGEGGVKRGISCGQRARRGMPDGLADREILETIALGAFAHGAAEPSEPAQVCQALSSPFPLLVAAAVIRHSADGQSEGSYRVNSVDVAIVGAGVVGSATAFHLLKHGFSGSILLIEKDTTYAYGCTARAVGGMRQQFSCPENILLSRYGLDFIRALKRDFGAEADVGFREQGYLLLATASGMPQLNANVETQRALGADVDLLRQDALKGHFPWLVTDGLAGGSFSRSGEGWIDPNTLMAVLRKKAVEGGATLIRDEVIALERTVSDCVAVTEERPQHRGGRARQRSGGRGRGACCHGRHRSAGRAAQALCLCARLSSSRRGFAWRTSHG